MLTHTRGLNDVETATGGNLSLFVDSAQICLLRTDPVGVWRIQAELVSLLTRRQQ